MRLAIWPSLQQPWSDVSEVVRHAEATGWDGAYVADHFMGDGGDFGAPETPTLEATAAVVALATATQRLRLGTLVLGATYRHPAVVANWAATVDHVSGGRLILGIGAGWQANEHEQYGIRLPPPRERVDRFIEACQALTGLLRRPRTDLDGEHFRLTGALCEPKPVQDPLPVLIGGKGRRMIGAAARFADQWNMWGLPHTIAERAAELDRRCEAIGRDPSAIVRSCQALVFVTDDAGRGRDLVERVAPRAAIGGPVELFGQAVADWAEVGVGEVVVPDFTLGRGAERADRLDALLAAARAATGTT
jgi:alkanesulfonate monooxygenase SsuD/methylene tetrahydromethanopterin reductase-like flavin-dependent oxidoreductase (luciferase family)